MLNRALNPSQDSDAFVKFMFTAGIDKFEYTIFYDTTKEKQVLFEINSEEYTIDDKVKRKDILNLIENFIGNSPLKSINLSKKYRPKEALILGAMLDLERKTILKASISN